MGEARGCAVGYCVVMTLIENGAGVFESLGERCEDSRWKCGVYEREALSVRDVGLEGIQRTAAKGTARRGSERGGAGRRGSVFKRPFDVEAVRAAA